MGANNSVKQAWRSVKPLTTIIVPTFNEADNVLLLVGRIRLALSGRPVEVLFVDDSPNLDTIKAVTAARVLYRTPTFHVRMYHREGDARHGGLSGAVTDGILRARSEQIIVMDGDLQHPPEVLPRMIEAAEAQNAAGVSPDVVIASRYCAGGDAGGLDGGIRHFVSRGSTFLAKAFFPKRLRGVTDPMTGFFLFRREAIDLGLLRPKGFKILLEMLARHSSLNVTEVPFEFAERTAGESKGSFKQGMLFMGQLAVLKHVNSIDSVARIPRFVQFGLIGGGVFAAGLALLALLVERLGMSPVYANGIVLVVTFLLNYLLNKNITWRDRTVTNGALAKFIASRAATSAVNYYLFAWLIAQSFSFTLAGRSFNFELHYLAASVVALAVIMVLNYIISDRWAFASAAEKAAGRHRVFPMGKLALGALVGILAAGVFVQLQLTLAILMAVIGVGMFVQASMEVWRMTYAYRSPEAVSRLRFPDPKTPKEKFLMIVPARHEQEVLDTTLLQLAKQTHPNVDIISVICDDDHETLAVARSAAAISDRITVVEYPLRPGVKPNKPLQLNYVLETVAQKDYTVIGIVDAEDGVHPELLAHVDTAFNDRKVGVVQGGVQLMNHHSSWYSLHNVLEYYKWFNSAMAFQSDNRFMPLGGNTIFIRSSLLRRAGGWPVTLTEDCSLGVLLSVKFKTKTAVYYDPRLATQEETPDTLAGLFKQRVRWCQGFYHEWRKGLWRQLPSLRQRLLAGYVLAGPAMLAFSTVMLLVTLIAMAQLKAPVALVLLMFIPLIPLALLLVLNAVFLSDFGKAFQRKVTVRQYATLFATFALYQMVLNIAGLWSMIRELRGDTTWHKTAHSGRHRGAETQASVAQNTATAAIMGEKA
ncbi:glycosyltransferase [Candidatus Saccharibacteria bacterium]|nr:glycosyltransferase [Candidatus Saccharibacteria bacterium]